MEYDDHSLVASRDREGRWTRHMYNGLGQQVLTQDPALRTTQQQWCRCGKLCRFVDGNGNLTEWVRDERGRETRKNNAAYIGGAVGAAATLVLGEAIGLALAVLG